MLPGDDLKVQIKTHPFTCASYNPFDVIDLDHIGPLIPDAQGNMFILVLIDAISRWVRQQQHWSQLHAYSGTWDASAEVVHTDRGTAFHNELVSELLRRKDIMNTVEKTSTGVSLLNNSIRLTERILLPPTQTKSSGQLALSDTMDGGQSTLVRVARDKQLQTDFHALVEFDPFITEYRSTPMSFSLLQSVEATSCYPATEARTK